MKERCAWVKDPEIGRFFLPGCMGGAVYGPSQCTCDRRPDTRLELEARVEKLEALVDGLLRSNSPEKA